MSSSKLCVLVVDDEIAIAETIAEVLRMDGHEVVTARDGVEALEAAGRTPFHLVLVDLMMPRLGGDELVKLLRARHGPRCCTVIMTSLPESILRGRSADYDWFMAKPVSFRMLADVLDACAQRPEIAARLALEHRRTAH